MCYNRSMKNYDELNVLKNISKICLISHEHPDADALSSMIVFRDFLLEYMNVKSVDIFSDCTYISDCYQAILENIPMNNPTRQYDIAIMMDSTADDRLGKYSNLFTTAKTKIVIDHHKTNKFQGDINIVDITSSTCQIVYEICKYFDYTLSTSNQGKLYAGLITDTNNLSVGEMNPNTFIMISEIYDNIDSYSIYEHFFSNNTIINMRLLAKAIENIELSHNGQIIISHITKEDAKSLNVKQDDYNGVINKLSSIVGCRFVLFVYPREECYYASMRARHGYDVSIIAKKFGGGGHRGASAFLTNENIAHVSKMVTHEFMMQLSCSHSEDTLFKF